MHANIGVGHAGGSLDYKRAFYDMERGFRRPSKIYSQVLHAIHKATPNAMYVEKHYTL